MMRCFNPTPLDLKSTASRSGRLIRQKHTLCLTNFIFPTSRPDMNFAIIRTLSTSKVGQTFSSSCLPQASCPSNISCHKITSKTKLKDASLRPNTLDTAPGNASFIRLPYKRYIWEIPTIQTSKYSFFTKVFITIALMELHIWVCASD